MITRAREGAQNGRLRGAGLDACLALSRRAGALRRQHGGGEGQVCPLRGCAPRRAIRSPPRLRAKHAAFPSSLAPEPVRATAGRQPGQLPPPTVANLCTPAPSLWHRLGLNPGWPAARALFGRQRGRKVVEVAATRCKTSVAARRRPDGSTCPPGYRRRPRAGPTSGARGSELQVLRPKVRVAFQHVPALVKGELLDLDNLVTGFE